MIIGRLGGEPEFKYTVNGTPIAHMRIAINESYMDRDKNKVSRTEWHSVVAFQDQVKICGNYLSKGSLVFVEGRLQTRKWQDQHGQTRYTTEIKATHVQPLVCKDASDSTYARMEDNNYDGSQSMWQNYQSSELYDELECCNKDFDIAVKYKIKPAAPTPEFEHILPVWTQAALDQFDPFCSLPTWQLAFHEVFSPKRRLFVEHSSGSVLCFAEKIISPSEIYLTPIESHWFFGCPLLGRNAVELFGKAMERITKEYAPHFPKILISGIAPDSLLKKRLLFMFANNFDIYLHYELLQCAASLSGGVDDFLSRRSANFRNKLKKSCKRALSSCIEFERVIPTSPEEASSIYSRMLNVEYASWKSKYDNLPIEEFYAAVIHRLSMQSAARVIMARCDDKDIGFIFGGLAGNIYRGLQCSYDKEWKDFSIGNILHFEQIKWLSEENINRYDMGEIKPHMSYKELWTEIRIPSLCLRVERK